MYDSALSLKATFPQIPLLPRIISEHLSLKSILQSYNATP